MNLKSHPGIKELLENWNGLEPLRINESFIILPENFTLENGTDLKDVLGWRATDYVLSEGGWTWFFCIFFSVLMLGCATLRYLIDHTRKTKTILKNQNLVYKYLRADEEKAVRSMATRPHASTELHRICAEHRKYPILFKVEFEMAIKLDTSPSCRHALKEANEMKNQNRKVIPYDFNRVVLDTLPDVADSDYINASYVDSLLTPKAYIVCQGPKESTIEDFWRMVWQENTRLIVMLTKTFDFIKVMCVQYWPAEVGLTDSYSTLKVELLKEEQLANFFIRTLKIYRLDKLGQTVGEGREICQFHYTEWTSHSNPFSISLLEYRRRIRIWLQNNQSAADGPIVVHCSDGAGRSGVYLAVDANLELHEEDGKFNIYGYLKKMRQARKELVEKLDQYKFVYDALEEFLVSGHSFFPVSELSQRLKQKSMKVDGNKNEYQLEFEKICRMTERFTIGDCAGGHRADNRFKNRNILCVPPDNYRPYLTSFQGNSCTDYINSVFVDGYVRPREYIVSEWPLRCTVSDLWSLVYDHDVTSVVALCNPPHDSQYPSFWPDKQKSVKYGPVFTIDHISHQHFQNIKSWVFKVSKKIIAPHRRPLSSTVGSKEKSKIVSLTELMAGVKAEPKTCQLFQLMCWPQGHKVPTSTNALVELMNMVERWRQRTGHGPVLVLSPDGMSRTGVYCAANACIEQVIQHGEVDVFQAVKTVRLHRPQLVNNITEYKYCYDVVLHYVLHFLQKEVSNK